MDTLKFFGAAILLLGFIFFILIRAIATNNYIRKSFYLLICGLIMTLFFVGGIVYDIIKGNFEVLSKSIEYFSFLIISIIYMISIPLFYYIKGFKRKQRFKNYHKAKKQVPTIKDKKEYVYIIYKYKDAFYLEKKQNKDEIYYASDIIKFSNNDYFHDEIVKNYIIKKDLKITSYKYIGKATKTIKKDNVFYCYRIVLDELPNYEHYELIDSYKLLSVKLYDEDKKILFTSVVNEDFNIEI